jgi:hypothetical protein
VVDDAKLEAALSYLERTDDKSADLKADVARTEYLAKLQESKVFLTSEGSVDQRKALAKVNESSQALWDVHFKAIAEHEKIRARRERAVLNVDVWRTGSANRRVGNV